VDELEASSMTEKQAAFGRNTTTDLRAGDVIEFTHRGERRTAEVMIVSDDDQLLLDLFDGDRPAFARVGSLTDVAIYRPDAESLVAA
jgi:hypothetical protein